MHDFVGLQWQNCKNNTMKLQKNLNNLKKKNQKVVDKPNFMCYNQRIQIFALFFHVLMMIQA